MRGFKAAAGHAGNHRPQATAQEGDASEKFVRGEEEGEAFTEYSLTDESETVDEHAPQTTKLLRQLRGGRKLEEVERSGEIERESTIVQSKQVTSHAQQEQSALPAAGMNMFEDSTDEEGCAGENKEIAMEMKALRGAQQWVNREGWDAAGEAIVLDSSGKEVDLRVMQDAQGCSLNWGDVRRQMARGAGLACDDSVEAPVVVEEEVMRDFALDKLDPTQRVFVERGMAWGRELVKA